MRISSSCSIVWTAVLSASLALAGCNQNNAAIELRVTELETQVESQQRKIATLATALTIARASVFDPPLQQFFDAPEFWQLVFVDEGACHNGCYDAYVSQVTSCGDDKECQLKAAQETIACHEQCGDL